jgi:hypothetical protein
MAKEALKIGPGPGHWKIVQNRDTDQNSIHWFSVNPTSF